jgi:acetyl esterase/lipase
MRLLGPAAVCVLLTVGKVSLAAAWGPGEPVVLWPGGAPGAVGTEAIDVPTLTPYVPEKPASTGTGVIVCPGGGYANLAMDHEGRQVAEFLNGLGVTAFVLKYRLGPRYHHPSMLQDAQRAIRYVRAHAGENELRADRIGIMGFSAGGHLASTAGTHFDAGTPDAAEPLDRQSSRPDFLILGYPVVTFVEAWTHKGSRDRLLGDAPSPDQLAALSNEKWVTKETPPTFLFHTDADTGVPPENSVMFYLALRRAGVPAELHIYEQGKHGVGLAPKDPVLSTWPARLADWLKVRGLLPW